VNKKDLSESDICAKFITPALTTRGWDEHTQIRREAFFTKGRIIVRGKLVTRGKPKFVDYLLFYKPNIPIALVEAKDNNHSVGDGIQQALEYADSLQVPFVFSSNGDGFLFHDKTGTSAELEISLGLNEFPSPQELWSKYCSWKGLTVAEQALVLQEYFDDGGKAPRYYQRNAINAATEAIAKDHKRLLLVMATGTGKTYTAFQIIWRLWKAGRMKRVLYLADRNVLIDQTMVNDFRPFGPAMAKLSTATKTIQGEEGAAEVIRAIDRRRRIDTAFEIYMSLYQAITGPEETQKLFKRFTPGFFDLVVVDECHRGSAAEDAAWREILAYFSGATQIGLTATPKETEYVSNIGYFGEPVYFYSLRQGISDGFLAPYKVLRKYIDVDVEGYRPEPDKVDIHGYAVEDRVYNQTDMERTLVIDERTRLVAHEISEELRHSGDRYEKTIVFCVDQEHAGRMRQALANENHDLVLKNGHYVMRITGNDDEGQAELDNFIDPESKYPVIATTSRLLTTGVDVQTCRLIVIDRAVNSMAEFKQIIGRGTRIHEDSGKYYFTIMDFRGATDHFADADFDGRPIPADDYPRKLITTEEGDVIPPEPGPDEVVLVAEGGEIEPSRTQKTFVDGVDVTIILDKVQYLDAHGKVITQSLRDFSRDALRKRFASLDDFLQHWKEADRRQAIVEELANEGLPLDALADDVGRDLDPFDLICYVAFGRKPLTRKERAENVRKRDVFAKYGAQARAVLDALLSKYQDEGVTNLGDPRILHIPPLDGLGTPLQLIRQFGDRDGFERAVAELQAALYEAA
jgi:type I restriction enzyme, R subunit